MRHFPKTIAQLWQRQIIPAWCSDRFTLCKEIVNKQDKKCLSAFRWPNASHKTLLVRNHTAAGSEVEYFDAGQVRTQRKEQKDNVIQDHIVCVFYFIGLVLERTWAQHMVCWERNLSMVERNIANVNIRPICKVLVSNTEEMCLYTDVSQTHHTKFTFFADQGQIRDTSLTIHENCVVIPSFSQDTVNQQLSLFQCTSWTTAPDLEVFLLSILLPLFTYTTW